MKIKRVEKKIQITEQIVALEKDDGSELLIKITEKKAEGGTFTRVKAVGSEQRPVKKFRDHEDQEIQDDRHGCPPDN
jgi:hypothetical protein